MTLLNRLEPQPVPLRLDEGGVLRVGQTRVRLDSVIGAFNSGACAEEVLLKYPSLELSQVYSVVTYYLWHRAEVDAYLADRRMAGDEAELESVQRFPNAGILDRLKARRSAPL